MCTKGSHGGVQEGYKKVAQNLHFTKPHITMITMGIPFVVAFEVESIESNF
jgi:hypothetical protein